MILTHWLRTLISNLKSRRQRAALSRYRERTRSRFEPKTLERRQVLNGAPVAAPVEPTPHVPEAAPVVVTAQVDGQADTFRVVADKSGWQVFVNDQAAAKFGAEASQLVIQGSTDADRVIVDARGAEGLAPLNVTFQGEAADRVSVLANEAQVALGATSTSIATEAARVNVTGEARVDVSGASRIGVTVTDGANNEVVVAGSEDGSARVTNGNRSVEVDSARNLSLDTRGGGADRVELRGAMDVSRGALSVTGDSADRIDQSGTIRADSGSVALSAGVVRLSGEVAGDEARVEVRADQSLDVASRASVTASGGEVLLDAGPTGTLLVSGTVDVTDTDVGDAGGAIHLLGNRVGLLDGARVDASGMSGGGTVLVGGDYLGRNDAVRNASRTTVARGAVVNADALQSGRGGRVIVWSDEGTRFEGTITARGGSLGGDGGFVETSGKAWLSATGEVDATATQGAGGTWLLDPYNISIEANTTTNVSLSGGLFDATGDDAVIDIDDITTALEAGTNVSITTGSGGTQAGNVVLNAALTVALTTDVTFRIEAAGSILIDQNVTASGALLSVELLAGTGITITQTVQTKRRECDPVDDQRRHHFREPGLHHRQRRVGVSHGHVGGDHQRRQSGNGRGHGRGTPGELGWQSGTRHLGSVVVVQRDGNRRRQLPQHGGRALGGIREFGWRVH